MKNILFLVFILFNQLFFGQVVPQITNQNVIGGINAATLVNFGGAVFKDENNLIIGGTIRGNDGDIIGNHNNTRDYWIVNFDSSLNVKWQKSLGGNASDYFTKIISTLSSNHKCN